ncbi:MAG: hypothetical protein PF439_02630 [Helicobacteraceae bacterium]|jgi:hypothetical protein|nr:hypothetical protein [Helicobacteraceae bacterium]
MSNSDDNQNDHNREGSFWENGRAIGALPSSDHNMEPVRKDIIKFALGLAIKDIRTYGGYKGDQLVEITSIDLDVLKKIKAWATNLGMETVLKANPMTMVHELFCITPDEDVYPLSDEKDKKFY